VVFSSINGGSKRQLFSDQEKHDFKSLTSLKEEVNTYFSSQLKEIAEKITNICILDKKVSNDLDVQEEKCLDVIKEIEKVKDEMASFLSSICVH